ncbi:MAG: CBS domain-containing protein [Desulfohalobiaceae bacterium]
MTNRTPKSMLSGLKVRQAMRKNPLRLEQRQNLDLAISSLIKYKANAALIQDQEQEQDLGLISKTDLLALYYAGLPLQTPLAEALISPISTCSQEDTLESALSLMLEQGIKRVYIRTAQESSIAGVLSYADIVGLLYRFCCKCEKSQLNSGNRPALDEALLVRDVMKQEVVSCRPADSIGEALEILSLQPFSALLVQEEPGELPGVLSKTDLILAYRHNLPLDYEVRQIFHAPALSCSSQEPLVQALRRMILADVHRLFVHGSDPWQIQGVLSLTDAARARSGSCRACKATRLQ